MTLRRREKGKAGGGAVARGSAEVAGFLEETGI